MFCNNPILDKATKEHVIPKWLIKFTGEEGRKVKHFEDIVGASFETLTVDAHEECNKDYGKFEDEVHILFHKIFNGSYINQLEINMLMDWLEKQRYVMWRHSVFKNKTPLTPKFGVYQRVGMLDRYLGVYQSAIPISGVSYFNISNLCFVFSPSFFTLRVKELVFVFGSYRDMAADLIKSPRIDQSGNILFWTNNHSNDFIPMRDENHIFFQQSLPINVYYEEGKEILNKMKLAGFNHLYKNLGTIYRLNNDNLQPMQRSVKLFKKNIKKIHPYNYPGNLMYNSIKNHLRFISQFVIKDLYFISEPIRNLILKEIITMAEINFEEFVKSNSTKSKFS